MGKPPELVPQHTLRNVYNEIAWTICRYYTAGVPPVLTLKLSELRWYYDGIRPELRRATDPNPKPK